MSTTPTVTDLDAAVVSAPFRLGGDDGTLIRFRHDSGFAIDVFRAMLGALRDTPTAVHLRGGVTIHGYLRAVDWHPTGDATWDLTVDKIGADGETHTGSTVVVVFDDVVGMEFWT